MDSRKSLGGAFASSGNTKGADETIEREGKKESAMPFGKGETITKETASLGT